jgi:hypothetical protein
MPESKLNSKAGVPSPLERAPILLCAHIARIHAGSRKPRVHEGLLEEISRTRAVVSLECPLRQGTSVRIDCQSCELRGKVAECKKWAGGYMAEVALPADQPWHPTHFKPDGLFNPNYLVCEHPGCPPDCVGGCGVSRIDKRR